jgi:hypothetical protein
MTTSSALKHKSTVARSGPSASRERRARKQSVIPDARAARNRESKKNSSFTNFALYSRSRATAMGVVIASHRRSNPESAFESGLLRHCAPRNDNLERPLKHKSTGARSGLRPVIPDARASTLSFPTRAQRAIGNPKKPIIREFALDSRSGLRPVGNDTGERHPDSRPHAETASWNRLQASRRSERSKQKNRRATASSSGRNVLSVHQEGNLSRSSANARIHAQVDRTSAARRRGLGDMLVYA